MNFFFFSESSLCALTHRHCFFTPYPNWINFWCFSSRANRMTGFVCFFSFCILRKIRLECHFSWNMKKRELNTWSFYVEKDHVVCSGVRGGRYMWNPHIWENQYVILLLDVLAKLPGLFSRKINTVFFSALVCFAYASRVHHFIDRKIEIMLFLSYAQFYCFEHDWNDNNAAHIYLYIYIWTSGWVEDKASELFILLWHEFDGGTDIQL